MACDIHVLSNAKVLDITYVIDKSCRFEDLDLKLTPLQVS